eukprot:353323-Chlamydomonas_euryale.AAC.1
MKRKAAGGWGQRSVVLEMKAGFLVSAAPSGAWLAGPMATRTVPFARSHIHPFTHPPVHTSTRSRIQHATHPASHTSTHLRIQRDTPPALGATPDGLAQALPGGRHTRRPIPGPSGWAPHQTA